MSTMSQERIQNEAKHLSNGTVRVNEWSKAGAAFDLRSDTMTTPTTRMLEAIAATTLQDDVFQEDPTTNRLEAFIAELTGKESALFVLSGTMGNQVSIRAHLGAPPHSVVCDTRCHIACWEAGGISALCGAQLNRIKPANSRYVTLEEVQEATELDDNIHLCPTKLISLENTLDGMIMPLEEVRRISAWAKEKGVLLHLDGARLWEVIASGAGELKDFCECFDSISLCFSKGLGAPIGSIIVGPKAWRERARHIRKFYGGGLRQAGVVTAAARVAVEDTFIGGKLKACHDRARRIASIWEQHGGKLTNAVETNMVWFDLKRAGISVDDFVAAGQQVGLRLGGGRLVVHYQIGEEAVQKIEELAKVVLKGEQNIGNVEHDVQKMQIETE
ncbi:hypothetical protein AMS68_003259 [Peltaster fructicola]|uniref:Aromatic amino acid beta-eliminating lyase/threonine aldolase domain-containing protein n=1 Tax=Peltaster fructicola TaxID=286661 RepID=A0A6H0XSJ8_9PEZI|nr:hypothetical protein AMS68_003259 [Peltaster fructicola]